VADPLGSRDAGHRAEATGARRRGP
jgi:hypothetical protein